MNSQGKNENVHFIVGMSRAGTNWMMRCLNTNPQIVALGETCFWGRKYLTPERDEIYAPSQEDELLGLVGHPPASVRDTLPEPLQLAGYTHLKPAGFKEAITEEFKRTPQHTPGTAFQCLVDVARRIEQKRVFVEKTPHHINWIPRISRYYPRAKFIIMERNPYDFMLSYKHLGDRKAASTRRQLHALYHPLGCSIIARGYLRQVERASSSLGDRGLVIRFEEIEHDAEAVLRRVCQFLDVNDECQTLPAENSSFRTQRPELSAADTHWLNLIAGREINRRFAIQRATQGGWQATAGSYFSLLPWGVRAARSIATRVDKPFSYLKTWLIS